MGTMEKFINEVKEGILAYLPMIENGTVEINTVPKNNEIRTGLAIKGDNVTLCPQIYLERFFSSYEEGKDLCKILEEISELYIQNLNPNLPLDIEEDILNPGNLSRLQPRLISLEGNEEYLQDHPFIMMVDLAIVFALRISEEASVPVTVQLAKHWNIDAEELLELSRININNSSSFKGMNEVMGEMMLSNLIAEMGDENIARKFLADMLPPEESMWVLSNKDKSWGASALLDTATMDSIVEKLGEDFYILPSSIHEVLVVPNNGMSHEELMEMVRDVNDTQVEPCDRLSYSVYKYDSKNHTLYIP